MKGVKANRFQLQCEIRSHRLRGNEPGQPNKIDRPHVVVLKAVPQHAEAQRLTIMHVALRWVITKDPIDHYYTLAPRSATILRIVTYLFFLLVR